MKNILHEQEEKHVPDYVSNLKHLKMDNCDICNDVCFGLAT